MSTPRRFQTALAALVPALALAGCVLVSPLPSPPQPVTVELVNATSLSVVPKLFLSSSAASAAGLFVDANLYDGYTTRPTRFLLAGETATVLLDCADVAGLGVNQPTFFDGINLLIWTPETRILLVRDVDFACGGRIRFVYYAEDGQYQVRVE
jgi:hypothetical protein